MEKQIKANILGDDYHFMYTMSAVFDINEKYGGEENLFNQLTSGGKEEFDAVIWLGQKLSEIGELARREFGYDPGKYLEDGYATDTSLSAVNYAKLKEAVIVAINLGLSGEVENEKEIDLALVEINKKKMKEKA